MKNTPLPWFCCGNFRTDGSSAFAGIDIGAENGANIAIVLYDRHSMTKEEVRANAALIVTACRCHRDLLEALKSALDCLDEFLEGTTDDEGEWKENPLLLQCRKAIAKAEM